MKKLSLILALIMMVSAVSCLPSALTEESTYEETLFDQSAPIQIDIQMDDEAWNNMIANASSEEYSVCNLVVNGVLYENVAIRPNTFLRLKSHHLWVSFPLWRCFIPVNVALLRLPPFSLARTKNPSQI